jgi:hypothetical protein
LKLPNAESAEVSEDKLLRYLLSESHLVGRAKARFFAKLGYTARDWLALRQALLEIAADSEVAETTATPHGTKYIVDGYLQRPGYAGARLRTIWIVEGERAPRLVTAFPL